MKFGNLKYVLIPLLLFLMSFSETFAQYDKDVFFFRAGVPSLKGSIQTP